MDSIQFKRVRWDLQEMGDGTEEIEIGQKKDMGFERNNENASAMCEGERESWNVELGHSTVCRKRDRRGETYLTHSQFVGFEFSNFILINFRFKLGL